MTGSGYNASQWYHGAGVWDGSNLKVFLDGVLGGTAPAAAAINNSTATLNISGWNVGTGVEVTGRAQETRITKDVARYSGTFTPTTTPFPRG